MEGIVERRTEGGNKHFRYQRFVAVGAVISSVFLFLDFHIVYLNKLKTVSSTALLLYFMINASNNNPNTARILELIKYTIPYQLFIFSHTRLQQVTLTKRKGDLSSICQVMRLSALV